MAGLRERKKRQTRQHLADVAMGLFLERGFDAVTVAEVAEAAEVSVNTVYNYFPAKEDLFLQEEEEFVERPSARVRRRRPGESAAEAILRGLRQDIADRSPWTGLAENYHRFVRVAFGSSTLMARLMRMQHQTSQRLAETLREEAHAKPDDHVPDLIASHLMLLQGEIFRTAGVCAMDGAPLATTARLMLEKLDTAEMLMSARVLNYARRPEG
ncbi:TetR/AcrR family transcriptional regulator [Streptomyces sp. DSM 44917]|uniref:TetR/AcrR family transcriptional regulator n=1 Tax=Streptomyces boetiae TaxID=3075541 RepID=A0ABU2L6L2_9ACTN|nr:TetR/AcrR family transcriptional regulator [Streptomyces sp. DSM 44917]MDT0307155.1 TetR/AcrR family transcriptional regulator [Streptomyces sp. DSM 44917]